MSAAMAHDCTPNPALMLAGNMFDLFCDTAAATLRAVAIVAEGEDIEASYRPRQIRPGAKAAAAADMRKVNVTALAERLVALPLHARDCGLDHCRGRIARCHLGRRPSLNTK